MPDVINRLARIEYAGVNFWGYFGVAMLFGAPLVAMAVDSIIPALGLLTLPWTTEWARR